MKLYSVLKQDWDRRALEGKLALSINTMEGHKAAGLPTGHLYYQLLWENSRDSITEFCKKYGTSFAKVAMGVPMLREMENLAKKNGEPSRILPIGIGIVLAAISGTVVLAMCHNLYAYLIHWVR